MDDSMTLDFVRLTENAAIQASKWVGKGDRHAADEAATNILRKMLNKMDIDGTIVIGEGERDDAPMLFIGEKVGTGKGPAVDIAVDPLEGTNPTATGGTNSMAVLAIAPKGCVLRAPDTYMDKIAVGPKAKGVIDLDAEPAVNIKKVAKKLGKKVEDMLIIIMDRDRNAELIRKVRATGARIRLIEDGDVAGGIAPSFEDLGVDMLMGIGAAPEGVITAAALKATGGEIQGRLWFKKEEDKLRTQQMGYLKDIHQKLTMDDMIKGDNVMFFATGVTNGEILKGVAYDDDHISVHSLTMRAKTKTIRSIETTYRR